MRAISIWTIGLALCVAAPASLRGQATPSDAPAQRAAAASKTEAGPPKPPATKGAADTLRRKQDIQKRVRGIARQLVASVIDIQLQQLAENGMQSHEWYRDIRAMRGHIDEMIDAEMREVVELLTQLETGPPEQREAKFLLARQKSREVLIRLLVERQNLLRRLRIAEMAAEVRRLIVMETRVLGVTESLPSQTQARRETLTLATVEDQRDTKEIFLRLKDTLREVGNWGGTVGTEASNGLRLIKEHRIDAEMDNAGRHLEATKFSDAATSERAVIKGLRALLEVIERARGLVNADQQAVQEAIRDLADQQEQIRQETAQADLSKPEAQQLIQKQADVTKEVAKLAEEVRQPAAEKPLEQAHAAADKAAKEMFEGKQEAALTEQQKVLDNLNKAAQQAEQAQKPEAPAMTDQQAQKVVADLEGAKKDLEKILQEQDKATETAKTNAPEAQKQENQIARELAEVPKNRKLPEPIVPRVNEAKQAAAEAANQMNRPEPQRQEAVEKAEQAIQRALSEVKTALADAQRREMALKVEALARAADSLDQAAAAERRIGQESREAARNEGLKPEAAQDLAKEQAQVKDVAAKVEQGLQQAAPQAVKTLQEAAQPMQQAGQQLQAAEKQPGEQSKPAAAEASRQADQAAQKLAQAAGEVRQEMAKAAEKLAALTDEQLKQAHEALQAVEQAAANQPAESTAQKIERLAQAEQAVQQAAADQQRAAGRPEAAKAMELAAGIEKAMEKQKEADRAADAFGHQETASPLDAMSKERQVAQAAAQLAQQAAGQEPPKPAPGQNAEGQEKPQGADQAQGQDQPAGQNKPEANQGPVAEALKHAQQAAEKAAKEMLAAKPDLGQAARAEARQALAEARKLAAAEAKRTAEAPAGQPNVAAQERVGRAIEQAQTMAQADAPQAAQTLGEADKTSDHAQQRAVEGNRDATAKAQDATAGALEKAAQQLADAKQQLAKEAAPQFTGEAKEADRVTDKAIPVDPGATGALQSAENQANQAAQQVPQAPQQAAPAEQGVKQALDMAAAQIAAREQQLARHELLAKEITGLTAQQQQTAGQIAQLAQAMTQPPAGQPESAPPNAQAMADAGQQLAQATEATIQAAREIAGQAPSNSPPHQATERAATSATGSGSKAPRQVGVPNQAAAVSPAPPVEVPKRDLRTADSPEQVAEKGDRKFAEDPWLAKLPPELRSAIRANAQRRPPRGYEDRLQRYFKNVD